LKLLADFRPVLFYGVIPHVPIVGMEFFQLAGEGVGVGGNAQNLLDKEENGE